MSKRRDRKADEVDHGTPTGESLSEKLDAAVEQFGPNVTISKDARPNGDHRPNAYFINAEEVEDPSVGDVSSTSYVDPPSTAYAEAPTARHWERADFVEKTIVQSPTWTTKQHLVAADSPQVNDEAWLIVADENNWMNVGKFKGNDYVEDAKLLYRESDRARAAEVPDTTEPSITPREALLQEAAGLIVGDRNQSYGSPTENFQNTADLWTVQFGHLLKEGARFTGAHIAQAQMQLKLARMIAQPKRDNYLDLAGYAACGWECEEDSNG